MPVLRNGTKGQDKFTATSAAEAFNGLANYDIVSYLNSTGNLTIELSNPASNTGDAAGDTFANIEYYRLGQANDTFTGSSAKEQIDGYTGNDTLNGAGGDDIISGNSGDDTVSGGAGNDSIWGGGGEDTLSGGANNDLLVGDKGNDILNGDDGNDILQGGTGNDTIVGGLGSDTAKLLGKASEYDFVYSANGVTITHARGTGADGTDFIDLSTEFLQFTDRKIARPSAPPTVTFDGVDYTDTGAADGITRNPVVTFSGTASDLDGTVVRVEVFNGAVSLGVATISGDSWSLTASLANGAFNNLRVVATDNSGGTSQATNGTHLTIDTVASPSSTPDLSAASDSGALATDNVTNIQTLSLTGTAEAGAIVRLYDADAATLLQTTTATGGVYAFSQSETAGTHRYYTTAEDVAGNVSTASGTLTVTLDTQAASVSGVSTAAGAVTFTAADALGPLSLVGTFAGFGAVNNGTATTLALAEQATLKTGMLQVRDLAGNPADVVELALGTAAANTITSSAAGSALYGFGGDDTLTGGTGRDALYGGNGNDRLVVTAGGDTFDGGAHATAGDTIDFSNAAAAVTFSLAGAATQNTGVSFGSLTWSGIENVTGGMVGDTLTGDANANVLSGLGGNDTLSGGDGNDSLIGGAGNDTILGGLGTDTAVFAGNYADYDFAYTASGVVITQARGSQATGADVVDYATELLQFADRTISRPNAPPSVTFGAVAFTDTGVSATDGITRNTSVTFSGTALDFDGTITRVEVFNGAVSLGVATLTGSNWALTVSLADGTYNNLRAVATDNGGTTGSAATASSVTIDTLAPAAPTAPDLSPASDSLPVDNDNITNIQSLDLSGTAEAGSKVRLYDAITGTLLATTTATGGAYAFTVTVASGTYNFTTTAEDLAGNVSSASSALTVLVDTQASTVVGITTSASSITFTASDAHGPLSLIGTFAGLGAVNNGMSTTISLTEQAVLKSGMLQVQDIAGNPSNVIGLGLGTSAANTLTGPSASSANALYGFGGDDILTGGTAGDVLYGGDGNDRLVVTAGGDTLDAGANTTAGDTIDFANATSAVSFNLAGTSTQNTGASFGSLTWFGLENIFGGSANDTLIGNSGANVLAGQGGNDTLTGGGGADTFVVTAGTDTITDLAVGGLDIVTIAAGSSALATLGATFSVTAASSNAGSATVATAGFSASAALAGGPSGWTLTNAGSSVAVSLVGSANGDTLIGGSGADTLSGLAGNDTLNGGIGGDIFIGGAGADTIDFGVFNDNVRDTVRYASVSDFGDTVTNFDADGTQDLIQFGVGLVSAYDDGRGNLSIRWAQSNNGSGTVNATVGQGNNDREGLILRGSNGEGVTNANLTNASAVATAVNAEFVLTAADGEDAIVVVNDTDGNGFSVWQWLQSGGGELSSGEVTLIGVFSANATVTTASFGFTDLLF